MKLVLPEGKTQYKKQIVSDFQRFGYDEQAFALPARKLSGGQKRRAALLRALWAGCDTLLLDEPFTGMDPETMKKATALLKERRGERAVLLATHDREKNTQYCETLYYYLICCRSLKKTCDALYTHRNTVLYRIRRLQEDFDIPLDDPSLHADLLLGVSLILFETKGPDFFLSAPQAEA